MLVDKLVTIIIPVYNVEAYIERCARSLCEQTYRYIEYIWVNDATPDASIEILKRVIKDFPDRKAQIRIVNHEQNKGLPAARNTGLKFSTGDYIYHCDSDDWVDKHMISDFIHKAIYENADIVYSDWYLAFANRERYMRQAASADPKECVRCMLCGSMRFNVWNKLIKREIYIDHNILFPDGYGMGEDMTIIKTFTYANKVSYIDKAYYHYMQINPHAFTKVFSELHWLQLYHNISDIKTFIKDCYGSLFELECHFFCLNAKLPLLISPESTSYVRWLSSFSESDNYISLNTSQSKRVRWLQQMALKKKFWMIRVHYYLVIKAIYGIVYR